MVIPDTVTSIEWNTFYKCSKLKQIDIPDSVTYIGTYGFAGCVSLEQIKLPKNIASIEEGTFRDCTSLGTIQLPDELQIIRLNTFTNCKNLKSVEVPSNVTKIEENAFSNCENLSNITFPEGLTSIGNKAFNLCVNLEKISFPDSLQGVGEYAFAECEKLSDIAFGAGITMIPNYCFYKDSAITTVILPQQMTTIGKYAFGNCVKLKEITIKRKVNKIDSTAFSYPSKMKICGVKNTYAENFAKENDIVFEAINKPATAIKLSKTECVIPKGEKLLITASIEPMDSSDELIWSSENEEIAKVLDGVITPINVGTTYVQAQAGNIVQKCKVTVYQPVTGVSLNFSSKEMQIGGTLQLIASVYPDNAEKREVIWKSDAEEIATVGEDGVVKALACGTANITVKTLDGGFERTCKITVLEVVTPTPKPQPTVNPTSTPKPSPTPEPQKPQQPQNANSDGNNSTSNNSGNASGIRGVPTIKIEKIVRKGKGKVKVTWKKTAGVVGYQVQYSLNKKMKAAKKKNCKTVGVTIKKLKKKKTYYIRVRAYKMNGKKKVYGKWSTVKKVKIKK